MMLAACRATPCATPVPDPQRALVQAYTRMILFPAEHGSRTAVVANLGTREVRLVEDIPAEALPETTRLRVEVWDRHAGRVVASRRCDDLQEAEAATVSFLAGAGREDGRGDRPAGGPVGVTFHPMPITTGCADEAGLLVLANGRLVAVLVRLSGEVHGPEAAGSWFVEAGFGPCLPGRERVFATLDAAAAWIERQMSGEARDALGR